MQALTDPANRARRFGVLGELEVPLALGLLRLSTQGRPEEAEAIKVIHHALDQGIRVLDIADTYALDEKDLHYGERLAAKALKQWSGPREQVRVLTKAGLTRPKGKWRPNARPERLRSSVEGSLKALGVERLFLFLLHVNDPAVPFEDSLATLAELQRAGKIRHLGLCNVSIAEVEQARRHFEVRALQCELSVMNRKSSKAGLVALAERLEIPFLAHRPLGGHAKVDKLLKNRAMKPLVTKYKVTPHEAALATLLDLPGPVLPLVGATKTASLDSSLRALSLRLDDADRALREKISFAPTSEALRELEPAADPSALPKIEVNAGPGQTPEVVIVMGIQGAGKSSRVDAYLAAGYERLNRDLLGGKLADLLPRLDALLAAGERRVVLDNTYPTRVSRRGVVRTAHRHGVPVRCVHLTTPPREALINVAQRMLERYGRLPGGDELKELAKQDPNLPPPLALARYAQSFEAPGEDEGFGAIERVDFVRRPAPQRYTNKGLLLDADGTLRKTKSGEIYPRSPDDVELLPGRREVLQRWIDEGYKLFIISNQSGVASKKLTAEDAAACLARTQELLDLPVEERLFCPHKSFPVQCFCRKPMPGWGVYLTRKYELAQDQLVMVGDMDSDRRFAEAIGARYFDAEEFFSRP